MKTYKQRTQDILQKAKKQKTTQKKVTVSAIAAGLCAAVVAFGCVLFVPFNNVEPIDAYKNSEYYSVIKTLDSSFNSKNGKKVYKNNYEKWTAKLKSIFTGDKKDGADTGISNFPFVDEQFGVPEDAPDYDAGNSGTGTPGDNAGGSVEVTDNQVAGVGEGDLFKRTDSHIFYLSHRWDGYELQNGTRNSRDFVLRVYSIAGANSTLVEEYVISPQAGRNFSGMPEIYLSEDGKTLTVISGSYGYGLPNGFYKNNAQFTDVIRLDVSNPASVREIGRNYLSGWYVSSRSVNNKLLIVNQFSIYNLPDFDDLQSYIPQYGTEWENLQYVDGENMILPSIISSYYHSVIMQMDEATGEVEDCTAFYGYSSNLYVSQEHMFLSREYFNPKKNYERTTEISCLSYGADGFEYVGGVSVAGRVKNQYSMDEYNGVLRVATTIYRPTINAAIYCVDMSSWKILGADIGFAPDGESVQSVRFDKENAYVCTAITRLLIDPVYAFNLSDPKNITRVDTGEIGGYSSSLIQLPGGFLMGIGYNENFSLKIEIYQKLETEVVSVATYSPEGRISFAETYKSYYINREDGLIGLGVVVDCNDGTVLSEYHLLHFNGSELNKVFVTGLKGQTWSQRGVLIDGYFYLFGAEFKVIEMPPLFVLD